MARCGTKNGARLRAWMTGLLLGAISLGGCSAGESVAAGPGFGGPLGGTDAGMDDGDAAEDGGDDGEEGGEDGGTTTAQANIQKLDDGTCIEIIDIDCPKGAMCNPPPPQKVPCPDEPGGGV